jgi:ketosteroid isomerase-like protein
MMSDQDPTAEGGAASSEVASALDKAHARARQAFGAKDLVAYMSMFGPELSYRQQYGQVIDRRGLASDVEKQFRTLDAVESSFHRESLEVTENGAVEVLAQEAKGTITAFGGLVRREWQLLRRARYVWENQPSGWCIVEVEVLDEAVGAKVRLGRSP